MQTIGLIGHVVVLVVHTWPEPNPETGEEVGRVISARKAGRDRCAGSGARREDRYEGHPGSTRLERRAARRIFSANQEAAHAADRRRRDRVVQEPYAERR